MGVGLLIGLVAGSGGDDAPSPPPPPPDNGDALAKQMEEYQKSQEKLAEEERKLREQEAAQQKALAEATKYTSMGIEAFTEATSTALDFLVQWNDTLNQRKENEAAVAAGLPPPNTGTNEDWQSYLNSVTEQQKDEEEDLKTYFT